MITISIPQDRVPVLIGRNGKTKEFIEKKTGTKINILQQLPNMKLYFSKNQN